jgi:AraC-like DNA-binding protein
MAMLTSGLFCLSAILALRAGLVSLRRDRRNLLDWVWGIFCISICFAMLKCGFGAELGPYQHLLGIGAAATCNLFWLVSRALFRQSPAIEAPAWAFALMISALIIAHCISQFTIALGWSQLSAMQPWLNALDALLGLFGSGVLVLTVYEMLHDYRLVTPDEQRVRRALIVCFSCCVLLTSVVPELALDPQQRSTIKSILIALSAGSIVLVGEGAVRWRRHTLLHLAPVAAPFGPEPPVKAAFDEPTFAEQDSKHLRSYPPARIAAFNEKCRRSESEHAAESALASELASTAKVSAEANEELLGLSMRIERAMRDAKLFLDPELKVAHLADALAVPDYKITRALTGCLAQKNFNQYVNRFRIAYAQALLRDASQARLQILQIALRSGFASLGPFNRAFKAQCAVAPSEYRAQYLAGAQANSDASALESLKSC